MFYKSFAIEGGDTTGKSTISTMMMNYLEWRGIPFVKTDYYNNEFGFAAMKLGLQPTQKGKDFKLKLLRHSVEWNIKNIILPAVKEDKLVIHDRCFFSTMVYNCFMENIDHREVFDDYTNLFKSYQLPIPTIMLVYTEIDTVMKRLAAKHNKTDSYEDQAKEFHAGILRGYLTLLPEFPEKILINNDPFLTQESVNQLMEEYLK